jgi:hypothetical protein
VRVRVANVDLDERQVDFDLALALMAKPVKGKTRRRKG